MDPESRTRFVCPLREIPRRAEKHLPLPDGGCLELSEKQAKCLLVARGENGHSYPTMSILVGYISASFCIPQACSLWDTKLVKVALHPERPGDYDVARSYAADSNSSANLSRPSGGGSGLWIKTTTLGALGTHRLTIRARTLLPQMILSKSLASGPASRRPSSATVLAGRRIGAVTVTISAAFLETAPPSVACR